MRYLSTRGGLSFVSFEEAATSGYAKDGGLYVPESLPLISQEDLERWRSLDYASLAFEVLRPFILVEELDDLTLKGILKECYADFPEEVIGVRSLPSLSVLELFRGPTNCFKDLGLPFLVRVVAHFAGKNKEKRTLLVATTGDTGPACTYAVSKLKEDNLRVVCCYPRGMISEYQASQMQRSERSMIISFEGGGDDMDLPIKNIQKKRKDVSGVNSYNVCRPLVQTVHFIWLRIHRPDFDIFALPTGAMGNLAAFVMASLRLPSSKKKLLAACNKNDFTYRALELGDVTPSETMLKTNSDAINIQVPYNFERVLYYAGKDKTSMRDIVYGQEKIKKLPETTSRNLRAFGLEAASVTDEKTLKTIKKYASVDYVPDPHTAVAAAAADDKNYKENVLIIATAHALKFESIVRPIVGDTIYDAYLNKGPPPSQNMDTSNQHLLYQRQTNLSLAEDQRSWQANLEALIDTESWIAPKKDHQEIDMSALPLPPTTSPPSAADDSPWSPSALILRRLLAPALLLSLALWIIIDF